MLTLLNDGISLKNIIIEGYSLGGASALHIASKYKIKAIVQNTFSKIDLVAKSLLKRLPFKIFYSNLLHWIIQKILTSTGWNADNTKPALALGENLLVIQADRGDKVIPYNASLKKSLLKISSTVITSLPDDADFVIGDFLARTMSF